MDQFREDVKKAMGGQTIDTVPDAPVDNSSDDTSSQAVNPLSGSVKIIYTGDDGLNVRKHLVYQTSMLIMLNMQAHSLWLVYQQMKSGTS